VYTKFLITSHWIAVLVFLTILTFADSADPRLADGLKALSADSIEKSAEAHEQIWNVHLQNTDIVQYHPEFHAQYSGPNSLSHESEIRDTISLDVMAGARLWQDAEFHVDALAWQGFGLSKALGVAGFPNGEAFRLGTKEPNFNFSRVFIRQTIGLGGEQETIEDDALHLAGRQDVRRVTLTLGKISAKDIFDNNTYANDPRTQFMNWSLMANGAWDYPADSLGFIPGFAAEFNQPDWTVRYGIFQVPKVSNGLGKDYNVLDAWSMVGELERRWTVGEHPGAVRLLSYLERAHMGSFQEALDNPTRPADIVATRAYRCKYGFGLNVEQEVVKNVGMFSRLGWNDDETEPWAFTDVGWTASLGTSIKGESWGRSNDTVGVAGVLNGISGVHQRFLAAGGTGILVGDGALTYGLEEIIETYYDFQISKTVHCALDFQYIQNPAFNQDRGPVPVVAARFHWEF